MCFFLTIAVPEEHADQMFDTFGPGFHLGPTANESVLSALPARYTARVLTSGGCSCDLYVRSGTADDANPSEHLRRKYAKRGWSDAKIARAVEQATQAKPLTFSGLRKDVIEQLGTLCAAAGGVAVVVHWYTGDVERERFPLVVQTCARDELPARAANLREDEVLAAAVRRAD
jgi:hypothetical protein